MKGSRNENREGRALPRIWFLSSKEEISVEKRFAKRSRKEEVKTGRAETDSSIFPTLLSSRKDRDRDRFLVAFDVHFSNDRVSFRLYMDFLNRGNRGLFFFFFYRVSSTMLIGIWSNFVLSMSERYTWNVLRKIRHWQMEYISEISDSDILERVSRDIEDWIRFIRSRLWKGNQIRNRKEHVTHYIS